jgi:hypothetical protein
MSFYLDFYGRDSLTTITLGTPVPAFETKSKVYELIVPFFENKPFSDDLRSSKLVKCAKTLSTAGAIFARVPLLPLSLNFNPEIKGFGTTIACFNMISYSSFLMWSSKDMIDHVFYSLKTSEHRQIKGHELCRKISVLTLSVISGLASQVPYFFLAWKYNPNNKFMIALSAFDLIPPVYSLYLLLNHTFSKYVCSVATGKILKVKKYFLERLEIKLQEVINGSHLDSEEDNELNGDITTVDKMNHFFLELMHDPVDYELEDPVLKFFNMKTSQILGTVLVCTQLFWTGYLSYLGVNQFTNNDIELGLIFSYVIISNLALTRFVMINSLYKMLNAITRLCSKKSSYNYISERLMPKTTAILRLFVLIIASASFIPAITLSEDFIDKKYSMLSYIPFGIALAFMNYLPLKNMVNTAVCYGIGYFGTSEQKKELKIYDKYKSLKRIIENSTPESLGVFLLKVSEESTFTRILERFELSSYDLSMLLK